MIKNTIYTLFAAFLAVSMVSCEKNNAVVGKDVTPPPFVKVATWGAADTVGTYVIPEPDASGNSAPYIIPIGVTNVSNVDRTVTLSYSSATAVNGQQFRAPESIVIPAGEAVVNLEIVGLYNGYESVSRVDNLKITIAGGDIPTAVTKTHYLLTMKKYWSPPTDVFQGIYIGIDYYNGTEQDSDPYPVEVSMISANGPVMNMQVVGLWGFPDPLKFTMEWADLEHGTTTVPTQAWVSNLFGYGQSTTKTWGKGEFTVSPNAFTIGYENTVSAGSFGKYLSVFEK
ncbi:MAG: hypothetical protein J5I50_00785 [Chitinophagaceae bacterium]|nr:hypothetical protein [Chitinophagaceae bacterium]